jgi:hypothetical protein
VLDGLVDVVDVELVDVIELVVGWTLEDVVGATDEDALPVEPSRLYTTMLALPPLGTVATQKSEPPAPVAFRLLVTPPPSIAHGRPMQLPEVHSIFKPNEGFVPYKSLPCQMGLMPSLTYVRPDESVLAPAT